MAVTDYTFIINTVIYPLFVMLLDTKYYFLLKGGMNIELLNDRAKNSKSGNIWFLFLNFRCGFKKYKNNKF
jgi:hypothetical protein